MTRALNVGHGPVWSEWANREAQRYYQLPLYAEAEADIAYANEAVEAAHAELQAAISNARKKQRQWSEAINAAIEADPPSQPPVDDIEPILAPAPEPIFTTDDNYAAASINLIDRKRLLDDVP